MLILLLACTSAFYTDQRQLAVSDGTVVDLQTDGAPNAFLVGTQLCPEFACEGETCPDKMTTIECFAQTVDGPVSYDGTCLTFLEPGAVEWSFLAQACPANDFGYTPVDDHISLTAVAADDVEGRLAMGIEELLDGLSGDEGFALDRPDDWRIPNGEPWNIVAGAPFVLTPQLVTRADGAPVAWDEGVVAGAATVEQAVPIQVTVTLAGGPTDLALTVRDDVFPLGTVVGVDASTITSLELAVLTIDDDAGISLPYGARAVARNAAGEIVLGAPVTWSIAELLPVVGPEDAVKPGPDYAMFSDVCTDPATTVGEQHASLKVSLGALSAETELVWTPRIEAEPQEGWAADPACQPPPACGCATGGADSVGGTLALLALAGMRRRTRNDRRSAAPDAP